VTVGLHPLLQNESSWVGLAPVVPEGIETTQLDTMRDPFELPRCEIEARPCRSFNPGSLLLLIAPVREDEGPGRIENRNSLRAI